MEEKISVEEAKQQVRQMAQMMASLYYHMTKEIVASVGEDEGEKIIRKAIWNFGIDRGNQQKERVLAAGYAHQPENYIKVADLPKLGWDVELPQQQENLTHIKITYCPFAEYWKEKNFEKWGKLYCTVDQAKYKGFHQDSEFVHLRHLLDNEVDCEQVCRCKQG